MLFRENDVVYWLHSARSVLPLEVLLISRLTRTPVISGYHIGFENRALGRSATRLQSLERALGGPRGIRLTRNLRAHHVLNREDERIAIECGRAVLVAGVHESEVLTGLPYGFVAGNDVKSGIRGALRQMIGNRDLVRFLGANAREFAMNNFSIKAIGTALTNVYLKA